MYHEIAWQGVYFSPWLISAGIGILLALLTAFLLNRSGLSRFFRLHRWSFFLFVLIYTLLTMKWGMP